jgi:hypothetical protein
MSDKKDEAAKADEEYERLKKSRFKQQKLPAWRPVPTIRSTTITFVSFGIIFVVLGIVILVLSNKIKEFKKKYHEDCKNKYNINEYYNVENLDYNCEIDFPINETMKLPVMVYYQINKFYQNHRRYVKSKNDDQLNGKNISDKDDCKHALTNGEMEINKNFKGEPLESGKIAVPCGLIAKSFFRDTFALYDKDDNRIEINEKDIAWDADINIKFDNSKNMNEQWIDMTNEHFIVWMRPSGLPNFRKLWGRIEKKGSFTELKAGTYKLKIKNFFDVSKFDGEKIFVVSTVNALGGKNRFLGISYIIVGCISLILAVVFLIGYKVHQNKEKNN